MRELELDMSRNPPVHNENLALRASPASNVLSDLDTPNLVIGRAQPCLDAADWNQAAPLLSAAIARWPDALHLQYMFGYVMLQTGQFPQARGPLRIAAIDGTSAWYSLAYAQCLLALGDANDAEAELKRALIIDPSNAQCVLMLASLYQAKAEPLIAEKRWTEATSAIEPAFALSPNHAHINYLQGYILLQTNRLRESLDHLKIAAMSDQASTWYFLALAQCLVGLGEPDAAIAQLKRALAIDPADPQCLTALADLLEETERSGEIAPFVEATHGRELAADARKPLARALFRHGDDSEAIAILQSDSPLVAPIRTVKDVCGEDGSYLALGKPEEYRVSAPFVFGRNRGDETFAIRSNAPYVAELRDVTIFSKSSMILSNDGKVVWDILRHPLAAQVDIGFEKRVIGRREDKLLLDLADIKVERRGEGIMLSGLLTDAYGHWLPEFAPKLGFFEHHSDFSRLPVIVDRAMPTSHHRMVELLAPGQPVSMLEAGSAIRVDRLLVAPAPAFFPPASKRLAVVDHNWGVVTAGAMRYLRDRLVRACPPRSTGRRLYLSRRNSSWRRLVNEDEIAEFLAGHGFETVFCENLTLDEQIRTFAEAAVIVGPNGSAMLNTIFAPPHATVIMFSRRELFNMGAIGVQGHAGLAPFQLLPGDPVGEGEPGFHSNYTVAVADVGAMLATCGIS